MPKDLLGALDFLSKTVQVGGPQVDDHVCYVQQVSEDIKKAIGWVQGSLVDCDAHWNENDRVDRYEDNHVRPALAPRVATRDQKPVLLFALNF